MRRAPATPDRPSPIARKYRAQACCEHRELDHEDPDDPDQSYPKEGSPCTVCAVSGGPCKGWRQRKVA